MRILWPIHGCTCCMYTGQSILISVVFTSQRASSPSSPLQGTCSIATFECSFPDWLVRNLSETFYLQEDRDRVFVSLLTNLIVGPTHPFSWCWCCLFSMLTCFLRTSLGFVFSPYSNALQTSLARVYMYQTRNYKSFFLSSQKSMIISRSLPKIIYNQSSPCH